MGHSDEKVGDVCVCLCGYIYILYTNLHTRTHTRTETHTHTLLCWTSVVLELWLSILPSRKTLWGWFYLCAEKSLFGMTLQSKQ
jgi:hypothetical protein